MNRIITLSLAVVATFAAALPAAAASSDESPARQVSVNYADLDLNTADGVTQLKARIKTAASAACGGEPRGVDPTERAIFKSCRNVAYRGAYGKIVRVELLHKLHDELKYDSLDALTAGIQKDCQDARAYFAG